MNERNSFRRCHFISFDGLRGQKREHQSFLKKMQRKPGGLEIITRLSYSFLGSLVMNVMSTENVRAHKGDLQGRYNDHYAVSDIQSFNVNLVMYVCNSEM